MAGRRPKKTTTEIVETQGATYWFSIPVGTNVFRVFLADAEECDHLEHGKLEGVTVWQECAIYIDDSLEDSYLVSVLGHELTHAIFGNSNEDNLSSLFHCPRREARKVQENVCVHVGPSFIDALQRAGLLKLPRLPR